MSRRILAAAVLLLAALAAGARGAAPAAPPPNILLIVADDLGWADVGWHGGRFRTPHMDRLVREGVELDRHYVQPVCSPTRAALLSGRWTGRFGPHVLGPTNLRGFPPGTPTLASALKECGYSTYLAGKWHLGSRPEWGPNRYGFDASYGSLAGAVDPWTHQYRRGIWQRTWHRDGVLLEEEGNATELVARQAVRWIEARREPWLVYVPFHAVHIPVDAPEEYRRQYAESRFDADPAKNDSLRRFAAFVTQLDAKVGDFVAALERTGQRRRTLVLFTSDNGGLPSGRNPYVGAVPDSPALSSNAPLRGHKGQLYEGGIRVCAFASWPGRLEPRRVGAPLHAADWMPTLTRLAGWKRAADPRWDGQDVWRLLNGGELASRGIYVPARGGAAFLHDGWKLIRQGARAQLFHVSEDPGETRDLAGERPERLQEMDRRLEEARRGDLTELPADLRGIQEAF